MMSSSFDKLSRMLTQEKRLGYKNTTVMGGFEKFVPNWVTQARKESDKPEIEAAIQEVEQRLLDYPNVDEADRPNFIHETLVMVHKAGQQVESVRPSRADRRTGPERRPRGNEARPASSNGPSTGERLRPNNRASQRPDREHGGRAERNERPEHSARQPVASASAPVEQQRPPVQPKPPAPSIQPEPTRPSEPMTAQASVDPRPVRSTVDEVSVEPSAPPAPKSFELPKESDKPPTKELDITQSQKPRSTAPPRTAFQSYRTPRPSYGMPLDVEFRNTGLNSPVTRLPGIKDAMGSKLANLDIYTVGDFLRLHPRRYDDYRTLKPLNRLTLGEDVTIIGQIWEVFKRDLRNNRSMTTATISDGTAMIEATWFNQPWLVKKLQNGMQVVISGRVVEYHGRLQFQSPEWEELDKSLIHTGRIIPVYPLTSGVTAKWLRNQVRRTVDYWAQRLEDQLPDELLQRQGLVDIREATKQIHFPDDWEQLENARRRLAFDELLIIQLAVLRQKHTWRIQEGKAIRIAADTMGKLLGALPFKLTNAQRKALDEIIADLGQTAPMNRLLQGDVGAGKTVVALAAMVVAALDDGQAAILAPTEILAEQHYRGMTKFLQTIGDTFFRTFNVRLLTGSTSAKDRTTLAQELESGQVDILIGTHAIIQDNVLFKNLRLAVIDEQHRFGVEQRADLRRKGENPHLLVMTATPIPRTLSLTVYGDLDVSIIDELPPGRQTIQTRWATPRERERAYSFIRSQIDKGRQAFIICPLVEESEKLEARSAIEEHKRLQEQIYPDLKVGLLHGRMKPREKDDIMRRFRDGEMQVLVSTSVVEVGIDVPNATVMLVEGANRFGLSQLHQFRGRVGRGEHKSFCLLLADKLSPEAQHRLEIVERTSNGFELAEEDLKIRGPGEFFGTRQSGLPDLKFVKLGDVRLLELARTEAQQIIAADPKLTHSQHVLLKESLEIFWQSRHGMNQ